LPLFFALLSGIPAMLQGQMVAREVTRTVRWGVVDEADILDLELGALPLDTLELHVLPTADSAREALSAGAVEGFFEVPADYRETGTVLVFQPAGGPPFDVGAATSERALRRLLVQRLLRDQVPPELAQRVQDPLTLEHHEIVRAGGERQVEDRGLEVIARLLVPLVLATLLLMALMTTSGYLVQAIAVEKENKVVEVLLSSADPDEILTGKLLGLGAAGLLQFAVWSSLFIAGALYLAGLLEELAVEVPWDAIAVAPFFFIVGYLFVGSLMLATGSLGNSSTESQKFTLVWGLLCLLPMLMLTVLMQEPHGILAQLFTWIPFTAPLTVILRMALDPGGLPWWEIAGAFGTLGLSTWLSIRFGARLFRVGLLLSGSWPGFARVLRQARLR
jgi:ABC-2 type transport system permease protein